MGNEFKDRLCSVMTKKNLEIKDVSDGTKISYEMVRRYKSGLAKPRGIKLDILSKFLGVDKSWLLFGTGDKKNNEILIQNDKKSFYIEVLDLTASAGTGYLNSDVVEVIKLIEFDSDQAKILFNNIDANNLKVINIAGDSMQGTFESGDSIYVDISKKEFNGDGIYVFSFGRSLYVKRLQIIRDRLVVISDNKMYERWEIQENELDQLFVHGKVMLSQSMLLRKHG